MHAPVSVAFATKKISSIGLQFSDDIKMMSRSFSLYVPRALVLVSSFLRSNIVVSVLSPSNIAPASSMQSSTSHTGVALVIATMSIMSVLNGHRIVTVQQISLDPLPCCVVFLSLDTCSTSTHFTVMHWRENKFKPDLCESRDASSGMRGLSFTAFMPTVPTKMFFSRFTATGSGKVETAGETPAASSTGALGAAGIDACLALGTGQMGFLAIDFTSTRAISASRASVVSL